MALFYNEYLNLGYLDRLSYKDTIIHRLDARTKVIATFAFALIVVSFPKYEVTGLIPFFIFPVFFLTLGDIPLKFIAKKVLIVSPFAIFVGIFNPLLDSRILYTFYGISFTGGWVSFISIIIKFVLTISSALLLIATTSFPGVCHALQRLGMPRIFISQLIFLYRYIFVLTEETMKILRAKDMRSHGGQKTGITVFIRIIGTLFIRTIEKADRIYNAMLSRGFFGEVVLMKRQGFSTTDLFFLIITAVFLYSFRAHNIAVLLGDMIRGGR